MEKRNALNDQPASNNEIFEKLLDLEKLLKRNEDQSNQPTSKPLNFKEACAYLGYAPSYLYKLTYQKIIPHYKPTGKIIFFSKDELDEWIFKGSDEYRVKSDECARQRRVKAKPAMSGKSIELKEEITIAKDPNQIEMGFDEKSKSVKRKKENVETEILIEFPLKSRREKRN